MTDLHQEEVIAKLNWLESSYEKQPTQEAKDNIIKEWDALRERYHHPKTVVVLVWV